MSDKKEFCKDVFGNSVFMADTDAIERQRENVDRLLLLVGDYMDWDGDISHVFVTNESRLGDFCLEEPELDELSKKLGFAVAEADYLHEIALRMGPKN